MFGTGADAIERGLVDRLGGLEAAVDRAAELGKVQRRKAVVRDFPSVSPLARLSPPAHSDAPNASLTLGLLSETGRGSLAAMSVAALVVLVFARSPQQTLSRFKNSDLRIQIEI